MAESSREHILRTADALGWERTSGRADVDNFTNKRTGYMIVVEYDSRGRVTYARDGLVGMYGTDKAKRIMSLLVEHA